MWALVAAGSLGVLAGVLAGLFGVGGGILFVPTLTLVLGLTQIHAEATSLLALLRQRPLAGRADRRHRGDRWRRGWCPDRRDAAAARITPALRSVRPARRRAGRLARATPACLCFATVTRDDELWIPLVDEPIGTFVSEIQSEQADIASAVESPRRLLAFRTFAYLRVGMLLGRLLIERDIDVDGDKSPSWAEVIPMK